MAMYPSEYVEKLQMQIAVLKRNNAELNKRVAWLNVEREIMKNCGNCTALKCTNCTRKSNWELFHD